MKSPACSRSVHVVDDHECSIYLQPSVTNQGLSFNKYSDKACIVLQDLLKTRHFNMLTNTTKPEELRSFLHEYVIKLRMLV